MLCFVKLMKLYIESKILHIKTANYSHESCSTNIVLIASFKWFQNLRELVKFIWNAVNMGKTYQNTTGSNQIFKELSSNYKIESVFLNPNQPDERSNPPPPTHTHTHIQTHSHTHTHTDTYLVSLHILFYNFLASHPASKFEEIVWLFRKFISD